MTTPSTNNALMDAGDFIPFAQQQPFLVKYKRVFINAFTIYLLSIYTYYDYQNFFFGAVVLSMLLIASLLIETGFRLFRNLHLEAVMAKITVFLLALYSLANTYYFGNYDVIWLFIFPIVTVLEFNFRHTFLIFAAYCTTILLLQILPIEKNLSGPTIGGFFIYITVCYCFSYFDYKKRLQLENLCQTDPITGALKEHLIDEIVNVEIIRAERAGTPLSVIAVGINNLEELCTGNSIDFYHEIMTNQKKHIQDMLRPFDTIFRVHHDFFVILLPHLTTAEAKTIASNLTAKSSYVMHKTKSQIQISTGVSCLNAGDDAQSLILEAINQLKKSLDVTNMTINSLVESNTRKH